MDTKQRILDAAEQLFAEHGFDGASLRSITSRARVNLAAVNYHFKSKEALIQEVLARKLGPLNRQRLELLDAYEAEAGLRPVALEKLVHAMVGPMLCPPADSAGAGVTFGTVMGRVYLERNAKLQHLIVAQLQGVIRRFAGALRRALPDLPPEELYWRMFFTMGTVSHTLAAPGMLALISDGACDPSDPDATLRRLTTFIVAAFRAPLPHRPLGNAARKTDGAENAGHHHRKTEGGNASRRV